MKGGIFIIARLTKRGITTIRYRSTDEAGNIEETQQIEIKIDRTPPTAYIGLDPEMRKITVFGSDELSEVTIGQREEDISPKRKSWRNIFSWIPAQGRNDKARVRVNVTLSDEAGHETDVAFTEERKYGASFALSDFAVVQDGNVLESSGISASYDVIPGRWGRHYASLISSLRIGSEAVLSWYDGWRDMTRVTSFLPGEGIRREREPGMIMPVFGVGENGIEITWN